MDDRSQDKLYSTTLQTIGAVSKLPVVRVDREAFLRKHFADSPHIDVILQSGPPAVYTAESLRQKANGIIKSSATKTSLTSFATGLPGNPVVMVAAGGADVAQYFGFAINLAQQIAYLFGEDDLFDGGGSCPRPPKSGSSPTWAPCLVRRGRQPSCRRPRRPPARTSERRSRPGR